MKQDKIAHLKTKFTRPKANSRMNKITNAYQTNIEHQNILEEDEDGNTEASIDRSKKSVLTQNYTSNSLHNINDSR